MDLIWTTPRKYKLEECVEERRGDVEIALTNLQNLFRKSEQVDLQVLLHALLEKHFLDNLVEDADEDWG